MMQNRGFIVLLIFPILFVCMISCAKHTDSFEIKGKLSNVTGDCFYASLQTGQQIKIDTIKINPKGEFTYRGNIDTLSILSLYFNNNEKHTYVLVDKGWKIEMKGDVLFSDLIDVKGGEVNNDLTAFKQENKELLKTRERLLSVDIDSVYGKEGKEQYSAELKNVNFELSNIAAEYIKKNPNKIASVILIDSFFKNELALDRLEENMNLLRGKAETFPLANSIREYSEKIKLSAVGMYAPYFMLNNYKTGKETGLANFRDKYLLLSFVSTTCKTCQDDIRDAIKEYDKLKKLEKDNRNYPKTEFATIVINGETKPVSETVIDSVKWTVLQDKGSWASKVFDLYNIHVIPYHILISPQGTILSRDIPLYAISDKINEQIQQK